MEEIPSPPLLLYMVPKLWQCNQGFPRKQLPPSLLKTQVRPGGPGWGTMFPTGGSALTSEAEIWFLVKPVHATILRLRKCLAGGT